MESSKKILWYNLAFMAFSTVWGFGNVLNGFVYFNGIPHLKTQVAVFLHGFTKQSILNLLIMQVGLIGHATSLTSQVRAAAA